MKVIKGICLLATAGLLVACGGGGDEAGDATAMSVVPSQLERSGPEGCFAAGRFADAVHTINGGQPPFRIHSSHPDIFEFGIHQVVNGVRQYVPLAERGDGVVELRGKDPQFVVRTYFVGRCVDPATITVLDYHSNAVIVEYVIKGPE